MKKILPVALALLLTTGFMKQSSMEPALPAGNFSPEGKTVKIYTTADSSNLRLSLTETLTFSDRRQPVETETCIFADPSKTFQTFLGIGGALTDAAAETFAKLPKDKQDELIQAYYDTDKGIGYTLGRTNMNSCDFSSESYTYVAENDRDLKTFDIQHDLKYRIPFIKRAVTATGGRLILFISPWSPPSWMKDNNDMLHGGKLKKEYYQSWADYYVKFIQSYEKAGILVWGLTVQNEPMANQKWESCIYTAEEEKNFVKEYLGPTLHKKGLGNKKIIIWDHNRDLIYQRASEVYNDPEAAKYVWGTGYHWYENWSGGDPVYDNVRRVYEAFPGKNLLFTEGCKESFNFSRINDWQLGEAYGHSMINDFNNGTVGWTDWNVLLDEKGGPNHVSNFCFAPIHADTRTGQLLYTNEYFYIGHFSKFIRPGAKRIISASSRSSLQTTAFLNTNGKLAVIVMNQGNQKIPYHLYIGQKAVTTISLPHSISTLVVE
jgi:glucosylceramidase